MSMLIALVALQLIRRPAAGAEAVSKKQGCSHPNTREWSPDRFTGPVLSANRHLGTTHGCWPGLPRCDPSSGVLTAGALTLRNSGIKDTAIHR